MVVLFCQHDLFVGRLTAVTLRPTLIIKKMSTVVRDRKCRFVTCNYKYEDVSGYDGSIATGSYIAMRTVTAGTTIQS